MVVIEEREAESVKGDNGVGEMTTGTECPSDIKIVRS